LRYYTAMSRRKRKNREMKRQRRIPSAAELYGLVIAFISRHRAWFASAAAVLVVGLLLYFIFRDTRVVIAVPAAEVDAYAEVMEKLSKRPDAPGYRILGYEGDGSELLQGKRPGLAAVSLAPWVEQALGRGDVKPLPAAAFKTGVPTLPHSVLAAAGGIQGTEKAPRIVMLPLALDPWIIAWHRDLIGGPKATAPKAWADVQKLAKTLAKKGVSALALPGREADADLAWLAVLASTKDIAAADAAFKKFPMEGRGAITDAMTLFGGLQKEGLVQAGSFSYPWSDALGLLLNRKAAGMLLPLSRFRGINPIQSAPLILSQLPEFPGSHGYAVVADLRVLVMPAWGAAGKGAEKVAAFLSEAGTQRALADSLGMIPAALNAPVRDGASYAAVEAARGAGALLVLPVITLGQKKAADFSAALQKALRSPREVPSILEDLYGGK
jgi:hypothetical protein